MLSVTNGGRYERHRVARETGSVAGWLWHELGLPVLLLGSVGGIAWAIRGTGGWDGVDGTIVPGMAWGLLWYYVCWRKGIDARGIALWLGLGIALGGELGYGQYVSWIQGRFEVGEGTVPVSPWLGYLWFTICGIGWAAPGGVFLGWALGGKVSWLRWCVRIGVPLGVGFLGWLLVQMYPGAFFPNYGLDLYVETLDRHLERTVFTNTQNFVVVAWWAGVLLVAVLQRDWATLVMGLLIGGGFGVGFTLSALWCLGYTYAPGYIDWWKMWELHAGFNLGLLYAVALYWTTRQTDRGHALDSTPRVERAPAERRGEWATSIGAALCVFLILMFTFAGGWVWTGILLGLLYVVALCMATWRADEVHGPQGIHEARVRVSWVFSVFLLLFILFHGATSRASVFLGVCSETAVDQYAWPTARLLLFVPFAVLVVGVTVWKMACISRVPSLRPPEPRRLPERMADVVMLIGFVGAITIWPAKIGVLYALFLCVAIFALIRLNRRFDEIDAAGDSG